MYHDDAVVLFLLDDDIVDSVGCFSLNDDDELKELVDVVKQVAGVVSPSSSSTPRAAVNGLLAFILVVLIVAAPVLME